MNDYAAPHEAPNSAGRITYLTGQVNEMDTWRARCQGTRGLSARRCARAPGDTALLRLPPWRIMEVRPPNPQDHSGARPQQNNSLPPWPPRGRPTRGNRNAFPTDPPD